MPRVPLRFPFVNGSKVTHLCPQHHSGGLAIDIVNKPPHINSNPALIPETLCRSLNAFAGLGWDKMDTANGPPNPPLLSLTADRTIIENLRKLGYNRFRHFIVLPSYQHPRWLLPVDTRAGLLEGTRIYCPHKCVAQALKELIVRSIKIGWSGCLASNVLVASRGPLPLEDTVSAVTGETHPLFAFSIGTRPPVCKLTLQIMDPRGDIIGYAKLPLTALAADRVRHEASALDKLNRLTSLRSHIPRSLYSGACHNTYALLQSALDGERGPTELSRIHREFLGFSGMQPDSKNQRDASSIE